MQELLAQSAFDKLKEGAIVSAVITEIRQNDVVVDIGGKSEGVIPANGLVRPSKFMLRNLKTRAARLFFLSIKPNKRKTGTTSLPSSLKAPSPQVA